MAQTPKKNRPAGPSRARGASIGRRSREIFQCFEPEYPEPRSELVFSNEFQLLVAVVLSAQCTDKKVNEVTPALFDRYPGFAELSDAEVGEVEKILRQVNYFRTKSKNIIALSKKVMADFGGRLPLEHDALTSLPGVGQKTANVVIGELGVGHTFPVDTHVFRLSHRLGLARGKTPGEVESELRAIFPPEQWRPMHHYLILHGRRVCKAQRPNCAECVVSRLCPSVDQTGDRTA
jgi:endonuclease-3